MRLVLPLIFRGPPNALIKTSHRHHFSKPGVYVTFNRFNLSQNILFLLGNLFFFCHTLLQNMYITPGHGGHIYLPGNTVPKMAGFPWMSHQFCDGFRYAGHPP